MTHRHWTEDPEQRRLLEQRLCGNGMSRRAFLRVVAAAGAAAAAGVGGASAAQAATAPAGAPATGEAKPKLQRAQVFRSYNTEDPSSHDFNADLYCNGTPTLWAGLTVFDQDFNVLPFVAQSWEANSDATVWTFKLRQDARWTNGDPVTAEDFAWSFKRQLDPVTASPYSNFFYDVKGAEAFNRADPKQTSDADRAKLRDAVGFKTPDKYTLVVELEGPRGFIHVLMAYINAYPAHRPSVEKYGDKWTEAGNIVSNGPFKLTSWEHNKRYEAVRNEDFFADKPKLERVSWDIVPYAAGLAPYENDEIDIRLVEAPDGPRVQSDPKLSKEYIRFSQAGTWYIVPEANHPPFDDVRVRRAMLHAIDRDEIANVVLQGLGYVAYTFNPPDTPGYVDPNQYPDFKERVKFDPKLAMDMLVGTPYEGGKNWPKITMSMREEGAGPKQAAEAIQAMLKENLNMDVDLEILEPRVFRGKMWEHRNQITYVRWYQDYPDPQNELYQVFYGGAAGSRHEWTNPQYVSLVQRAAGETNWDRRFALYREAEKIMQDEAAIITVYYPLGVYLVKPYVKGMPTNKVGLSVPNWNIYVDMYRQLWIE